MNPTKLHAVRNVLTDHPLFRGARISAVDANVAEFDHPKTLGNTISGAKQRAKTVFTDCAYSFGLESGIMPAPDTKSGFLETTVCAIYDGKNYHLGLSPSFEWPKKMIDLIIAGKDGSQAFKELGLTSHEKIGVAEGAIFILTHGKINRTKVNELAVVMALVHLENPNHY